MRPPDGRLSPACRGLLAAKGLSIVGDQLARVAVALLVLRQTHSVVLAAVAFAASLIPAFLGAMFLSGVGDRQSQRTVLIVGDAGRALTALLLAVPGQPVWLVLGLVAVLSLLDGPCGAARAALLASLSGGPEQYQHVTSLDEALSQTGQAVGYLLGGSVVLLVGVTNGLLVDAATFIASGALIAARLPRDRTAGTSGAGTDGADRPRATGWGRWLLTDAALGWQALLAPPCLALVLRTWLMTAATVAPEGVAVAWAQRLGHGPLGAGLLLAANPAGAVTGLIYLTLRAPRNTARLRTVLLGAALLPLVACAANPPLPVAATLVAVSGAGMTYSTLARVAFAHAVATDVRSRAFGIASSGLLVSQGVGILAVGAFAGLYGEATAVAAGAALCLCLCLAVDLRRGHRPGPPHAAVPANATGSLPS